ncbi:tetratricopeptide repeat protein [Rubripirellula sp.]|nr:tetratricopeptide repeat protein [Rubripirellula sp.]MDB4633853.1 tetratricopeptide repeat protein [Rubripirellula sp.]MDB4654332.1 tetratricopeptide repeat protein [Rubripirellula sp.]
MPSRTNRYISSIAIFTLLLIPAREGRSAEGDAAKLDQLTSQQNWEASVELARNITTDPVAREDLTFALARLARGLQNDGQLKPAVEFYQLAVTASESPLATNLSDTDKILVRLAASEVMVQSQNIPQAIATLEPILGPHSPSTGSPSTAAPIASTNTALKLTAQQRKIAVWVLLRAGSASLSRGAYLNASSAYSIALSHADPEQRPLALLGDAWATAVRNERSADAVNKLASFVDQYPDHKDAPSAARGCAQCLKQLGRDADSTAMLSDLLNRWPDSTAAIAVVRTHCGLSPALIPSAVKHWSMAKANANDLKSFDASTTMLGLIIASETSELVAWSNLSAHLAITDTTGQTTSDTLRQLQTEKRESDAEQLAVKLISSTSDRPVAPAAREAACRWAGRTSRWSMLAIASEAEDLNTADSTRTLAVERLFAEALTQTGQTKQAHAWWVHLADVRSTDDFRILIRCAETETAFGNDADKAEQRIAAARKAANGNAASITLTEMLESELAIRRSNFDEARRILEQVVRSAETANELRGRAQWLIGETWYMQRRHKDAIEAYRKVEAMDTTGIWVAASYLQAGKSFEQMGRVKEATLCYGAILSRFADTSYAAPASNRIAALSSDRTSSPNSSSQPTIRR